MLRLSLCPFCDQNPSTIIIMVDIKKMTDSAIYRPERLEFVVKTIPNVCDNVATAAVLPWGSGTVRDDLGLEAI